MGDKPIKCVKLSNRRSTTSVTADPQCNKAKKSKIDTLCKKFVKFYQLLILGLRFG